MSIRLTGISIMAVLFLCATAVSVFSADEGSPLTENWGKAYTEAKNAQIAKPDGGKSTSPVKGFDGKAAENTMEAYQKNFTKSAAKPSYTLNLGGISGVGSK